MTDTNRLSVALVLGFVAACGSDPAVDELPVVEPPVLEDVAVTLTHNAGRSVGVGYTFCGELSPQQEPVAHSESRYYQIFDLAALDPGNNLSISEFEFGVYSAVAANTTQPVVVSLYTLAGSLTRANLTLLGQQQLDLVNQDRAQATVTFDQSVSVPDGIQLVAEVYSPDGTQAGDLFLMGLNNFGHSGPSYVQFPGCGQVDPIELGVSAPALADSGFLMELRGLAQRPVQ